jgi:hypothetical protein
MLARFLSKACQPLIKYDELEPRAGACVSILFYHNINTRLFLLPSPRDCCSYTTKLNADSYSQEYRKDVLIKFRKDSLTQERFTDQMNTSLTGITQYGMPAGGKFNYPSDKRRTKQNTEKMIEAEKNLDHFWSLYDTRWKKLVGKTMDASMGEHVPIHRGQPLERTAPWVEPAPKTKEDKEVGSSTSFTPLDIPQAAYYDPTKAVTKAKLKTKGVASKGSISQPFPVAAGEQPDKQPVLKVDKRTLKVFSMLFHIPNVHDQPGEIPWKDFLYAMSRTGFVPQKLYGSIWQFTPQNLDVERTIQFHEPHPGVKLPFTWARRIGRRLWRAYGWYGAMFALEDDKRGEEGPEDAEI